MRRYSYDDVGMLAGVLWMVAVSVGAQTPPENAKPSPTVLSADEAARRAANPSLPSTERLLAYWNVDRMPPAERERALLLIAASPDPALSERAGMRLVSDDLGNPNEVAMLLTTRFPTWSVEGQTGVVQLIAKKVRPAPPFVELARSFLRRALEREAATSAGRSRGIEAAALILASNGIAEDRPLIGRALRSYTDSAALWYAVAASGGATNGELELAKERYRDPARQMALRVAAATAMANTDDQAGKFVIAQVERTLAELADKDELSLYSNAPGPDEILERQEAVSQQLESLPAMRFFSAPAMMPLVGRGIEARNEFVRVAASVSAAMRWPELMLKAKPSLVSEADYERLVAVLVLRFPELTSTVEASLGRRLSAEAKEWARTAGLGGFGRAGSFVNGL